MQTVRQRLRSVAKQEFGVRGRPRGSVPTRMLSMLMRKHRQPCSTGLTLQSDEDPEGAGDTGMFVIRVKSVSTLSMQAVRADMLQSERTSDGKAYQTLDMIRIWLRMSRVGANCSWNSLLFRPFSLSSW